MARHERLVLGFTALYLSIATPAAVASENHEFVLYLGVLVLLAGLVFAVHRRVGLHPASLWCLSVWGLVHLLGGLVVVSEEVGVLYSWWIVPGRLKFDQLVHAYGFGVTTWVVWQGLRAATGASRPTAGLLFLAFCAGTGLGALNEVVEFVATLTVPETNVGGYVNTGWDLVANVVGALIAVVAIALHARR